jgi:hypothetical protein
MQSSAPLCGASRAIGPAGDPLGFLQLEEAIYLTVFLHDPLKKS